MKPSNNESEYPTQQAGLARIGSAVRTLTPPQLDFVVIVYPAQGPIHPNLVSCVLSTTVVGLTARACDAAAMFIAKHKGDTQPKNS